MRDDRMQLNPAVEAGLAVRNPLAIDYRTISMRTLLLLLVVLMFSGGGVAYSVLTHEEIVDLLWADQIKPLILKRYPGLSAEQITEAHAYAYGGAVIQDLGYYPFGSVEFSNLVHYVRRVTSSSSCWRKAPTQMSTPSL